MDFPAAGPERYRQFSHPAIRFLLLCKTNRRCCQRFTERIQWMTEFFIIRLPPALRCTLSMADHHKAVQLNLVLFDSVEKIQNSFELIPADSGVTSLKYPILLFPFSQPLCINFVKFNGKIALPVYAVVRCLRINHCRDSIYAILSKQFQNGNIKTSSRFHAPSFFLAAVLMEYFSVMKCSLNSL